MRLKKPFLHGSPAEQLVQLKSWLFDLVDKINYILDRIEVGNNNADH